MPVNVERVTAIIVLEVTYGKTTAVPYRKQNVILILSYFINTGKYNNNDQTSSTVTHNNCPYYVWFVHVQQHISKDWAVLLVIEKSIRNNR